MLEPLFAYNDWAGAELLRAAAKLTDAQLDKVFDIGRGSLRTTLQHIYNGEFVWLRRWQGNTRTPWPNEDEPADLKTLSDSFQQVWRERDAFLRSGADLSKTVTYLDSKGSLFEAPLRDMIFQMFVHSTHHRAQAANIVRRLDAGLVELDYMMRIRRPAQ